MFFGEQSCTYPNTDGLGLIIAGEHDQPGLFILFNQIESPQSGLSPVSKGKQTRRNITLLQYVLIIFIS